MGDHATDSSEDATDSSAAFGLGANTATNLGVARATVARMEAEEAVALAAGRARGIEAGSAGRTVGCSKEGC